MPPRRSARIGYFTVTAEFADLDGGELWQTRLEVAGGWLTVAGVVAAYVQLGNRLADALAALDQGDIP